MIPFSVLDLSPIVEGGDASQSFRDSLDLARHAEAWGYERFWLAEHHSMPGIASAATSVVIGHVAAGTKTIRVGAGGIMLPNHAPLVIAEQFGTLAALFPGRIDLGLGRAPGSDQTTARALRRNLMGDVDSFPNDVLELINYFRPPLEGQPVIAVPGAGQDVPVWILGSSTYGAQLAAMLGLPYAFASHFAPAELMNAIDLYRRNFRPSEHLAAPYIMAGVNIFAADTDAEARFLTSSMQQAFVNLRRGRPSKLQPPIEGYEESLTDMERATLRQITSCSFTGSKDTVREGLSAFLQRTGVDEIIIACQMYDHAARLRSYEIAAEVRTSLA
ncbi:LLM class flavin-dependent oxidoreductase [Caulobacter sp. NIBR2454]|uniref:LLM class flavin-dependent oxidoreductase n=1 Tax=Caulobacter sp. NIBR2454 TaxID=3015996 RepID=UPI0022B72262|nr:LLM class flavin-dependent oxidoreductase [Caulobacter sp. NIBR2454]